MLNVHFNFDILDVNTIDDKGQTVTIPMYLSVSWVDTRIRVNHAHPDWHRNLTGLRGFINEDTELLLSQLWIPNLDIYGLKEYQTERMIKAMSGFRIAENKTIVFNQKIRVTFSCRMLFDKYPFDVHTCKFRIGSCE